MKMPIRQERRVDLYLTQLITGPSLLEICGACNVRVVALGGGGAEGGLTLAIKRARYECRFLWHC